MATKMPTRFRAYQLGSEGSSFSYFDGSLFTLIEARLNDVNLPTLTHELSVVGKSRIDKLHITSWDKDHCSPSELEELLTRFTPSSIECPGYEPHTECGAESLEIVERYRAEVSRASITHVTPDYIASLESATGLAYTDIFYWPKAISAASNDNSTVKFFRRGSFNVLSLGDVEAPEISSYLRENSILQRETDVLILAHHGADNGFTTKPFLKKVKPTVAICTSNYDNKFEHPRQEIRDLLYEMEIPVYTTKTGDVIIEGDAISKQCLLTNLKANSELVSSRTVFVPKKRQLLLYNDDTLRNIYGKNWRRGPGRPH